MTSSMHSCFLMFNLDCTFSMSNPLSISFLCFFWVHLKHNVPWISKCSPRYLSVLSLVFTLSVKGKHSSGTCTSKKHNDNPSLPYLYSYLYGGWPGILYMDWKRSLLDLKLVDVWQMCAFEAQIYRRFDKFIESLQARLHFAETPKTWSQRCKRCTRKANKLIWAAEQCVSLALLKRPQSNLL